MEELKITINTDLNGEPYMEIKILSPTSLIGTTLSRLLQSGSLKVIKSSYGGFVSEATLKELKPQP